MKVILILDAKGNTGKTTIGLNIATCLAKEGINVGFLEINFLTFDSFEYLKLKNSYIYDNTKNIDEYFVKEKNIYIFNLEKLTQNFLLSIDKKINILLIELKNNIKDEYIDIADKVFLISELTKIHINHTKKLYKYFLDKKYPSNIFGLLINKNTDFLLSDEDIQDVVGKIKISGKLPYKKEMNNFMEKGDVFYLKNKKDKFSKIIEEISKEILNVKEKNNYLNFKEIEEKLISTEKIKKNEGYDYEEEDNKYSEDEKINEIKKYMHKKLFEEIDIKSLEKDAFANEKKKKELHDIIKNKIRDILNTIDTDFKNREERENFIEDLFNEVVGLGLLEKLLKDNSITEIMVNKYNEIYIERQGKLKKIKQRFTDNESVLRVIKRIVLPLGRRIDESMPYVDARLKDGSRVNAIIPPLALDGPVLTIRKFSNKKLTIDDLINFGSITKEAAEYLKDAVINKKNILISGGTGSGKTTLLNILSSFIPEDERIITIEDSAELRLSQEHVVRLESRPPNIEGKGEITIRDLVKNALRMRPDRIVVGECRGGEALDMLQAMNTGHEGSMTTIHANSPRDALSRLEVMVLMAGVDLPLRAIREQIKSAVDIIIQQSRLKDGSRKVTYISKITGMEGDIILMHDVFKFEIEENSNNKITGKLKRVDLMKI